MATLDPSRYEVVLITPLPIETRAALLMLDERHHGRFPVDRGDDYVYHAGAMAGHNVAIATLPAGQEYGTGAAAALANHIKTFFPALWFGLLVGVAAGLPNLSCEPARDIRLGDVLVALPEGETAAVIAYELGKETEDGFQLLRHGHVLATTAAIVRSAIGMIRIEAPDDADKFLPYYEKIRDKQHANGYFSDPGQKNDVLFITKDGVEKIATREPRPDSRRVRAWYGPIGAGDKLWKNARPRDELREKYGLIGLEMEAAGTMNQIPVGVIRGVCDYGDRHKNEIWQPYAAAMAAAYARALLDEIPRKDPVAVPKQPQQLQVGQSRHMEPTQGRETRVTSEMIPFARDKDFVKRGDTFELIERSCRPGSRAALVGFGGVGKSQLAIEYGYRTQEQSPDTWVFWIHASNSARFEQGFQEIAAHVDIPGRHDSKSNQLELVHNWLRHRKNGPWLLILDNVDDASFLKSRGPGVVTAANASARQLGSYIPHCQHGSVLVTSRMRTASLQLVEDANIIAVEPMQEGEATQLFQKKLGRSDEACATELAAALDYMPLAIVQAAAYVLQRRPRYSLQNYLHEFRNSDRRKAKLLSLEAGQHRRDSQAKNAIFTTWQISFHYIQKIRPSAADLLSLMSFCDRQGIPDFLLRSHDPPGSCLKASAAAAVVDENNGIKSGDSGCPFDVADKNNDDVGDIESIVGYSDSDSISEQESDYSDQDSFENDIIMLRNFSFITANEDGTTFEMHRLVQLSTIEWLRAQHTYAQWRHQFLAKLAAAIPPATYDNWSTCEALFPHAKRIASERPTADDALKTWAQVMYKAARYAIDKGKVTEVEDLSIHTLKAMKKLFGKDHLNVVAAKELVADAYRLLGRTTEAEKLLMQIMEGYVTKFGPDHLSSLRIMSSLAGEYRVQKRWKEAELVVLRMLEILKESPRADDDGKVVCMGHLASICRDQGRLAEAEELGAEVAKFFEEKYGADHRETLRAMNNLATTYDKQERWEEAEELYMQIIDRQKKTLGANHPNVLVNMWNLSQTFYHREQYETARELYLDLIERQTTQLGANHPHTLRTKFQLGQTFWRLSQWETSERLLLDVMNSQTSRLGADHVDTLRTKTSLAEIYLLQNRWNDAEKLEVCIMEAHKARVGVDHADTWTSMEHLGLIYFGQDRLDEAEEVERQVLEGRKRTLGEEHPDTIVSMHRLAYTYWKMERREEAKELMRKCAQAPANELAKCHLDHETVVNTLAEWESWSALNR